MRKGEKVLLRALGGQALVRRFLEAGQRVAYVTDEDGLKALSTNKETNRIIGFPWEDVFVFRLGVADGSVVDWSVENLATRR